LKPDDKIRILLVDDHYVVRMGLIGVLDTEPDMKVVGQAADGSEAVALYEKLKPTVVLMDLRMPVKDGITATAEIRLKDPNARILILSTYDGDAEIHRAIRAGARGYALKNFNGRELTRGVRAVAKGEEWIPKAVATRLASRELFGELTPREIEVLQHMATGLANKEIADVLTITSNTVKDHLKNIMTKLHVADRTEAVTAALQRGIIRLPEGN
jgi:DNA-binding NarL/FixJ family response regulator